MKTTRLHCNSNTTLDGTSWCKASSHSHGSTWHHVRHLTTPSRTLNVETTTCTSHLKPSTSSHAQFGSAAMTRSISKPTHPPRSTTLPNRPNFAITLQTLSSSQQKIATMFPLLLTSCSSVDRPYEDDGSVAYDPQERVWFSTENHSSQSIPSSKSNDAILQQNPNPARYQYHFTTLLPPTLLVLHRHHQHSKLKGHQDDPRTLPTSPVHCTASQTQSFPDDLQSLVYQLLLHPEIVCTSEHRTVARSGTSCDLAKTLYHRSTCFICFALWNISCLCTFCLHSLEWNLDSPSSLPANSSFLVVSSLWRHHCWWPPFQLFSTVWSIPWMLKPWNKTHSLECWWKAEFFASCHSIRIMHSPTWCDAIHLCLMRCVMPCWLQQPKHSKLTRRSQSAKFHQ